MVEFDMVKYDVTMLNLGHQTIKKKKIYGK